MKLDKQDKRDIFEDATSWIVVFAMFIYGFGKIIQFKGAAQIDTALPQMTGMQLMWAFYGYSFKYALILGFFEVSGGVLILIPRTRLLGCLFVSTILVNVIIQDIVFGIPTGALRAAILYQVLILVILWLHREQFIKSLKSLLLFRHTEKPFLNTVILKLFLAFVLFVIFRIVEYYVTIRL